jgi:repressor LexA
MSAGESQFGPWLRRKLVERHLSLAQLCRSAGCDYTYLWRIIHADTARGRRYTRPSYSLTRRVGEALGAPREALIAAGYEDGLTLEEARHADRLARLEQDVATLRAEMEPRKETQPQEWGVRRLPLLGHVRAGDLHEALESPGEWIELPEFITNAAGFALRVRGDSMAPTLLNGDILTIRPQVAAESGQLVVAILDDEVTLKRYEVLDGVPTLVADNPEWAPVRCGPRVRLVGVVTGSFRPPEVLSRRPG